MLTMTILEREIATGEQFLLGGRRASLVLSEDWDGKHYLQEFYKQKKVCGRINYFFY